MSYAQSGHDQYVSMVMQLAQSAQPRPPDILLQTLQSNLANPVSQISQDLYQHLETQTSGRWRQGLHQTELYNLLRPWTANMLQTVEVFLRQQDSMGGMMHIQPAGYAGGFVPPPIPIMSNPTGNVYDSTQPTQTQQRSIVVPVNQPSKQHTPSQTFETGRNIVFELSRLPTGDFVSTPLSDAFRVTNYMSCEYEKERLLTAEIQFLIAQNTAKDAGFFVQKNAPQEVVRGTYADIVLFNELFHVPMAHAKFEAIATSVSKLITGLDWRTTLATLRKREYDDFKIISDVLSKLLNTSMYRRMRLTKGDTILGIDTVDDLALMDDRNADFGVARHANYWSTFNSIVVNALQNLFTMVNIVSPTDKNFGDFIACNDVIYYKDGRTKFDYGTFREQADYKQFIDSLLDKHTVVRIPRAIVLTNALEPQLIAQIKAGTPDSQRLLHKITTVGTTLLGKLEYPKREEIYGVVCLDKTKTPEHYCELINIGRTLDEDLVLLP